MVANQTKYVRINGLLRPEEQRVVASHEAGHLICHSRFLQVGAFKDNDIYNATGKLERESNFFGTDFMIDDEKVLELMHSGDANFFSMAHSLYVPVPFSPSSSTVWWSVGTPCGCLWSLTTHSLRSEGYAMHEQKNIKGYVQVLVAFNEDGLMRPRIMTLKKLL